MFQHFLALLTLMLIILLDITLLVMKQGEEKLLSLCFIAKRSVQKVMTVVF